MAGRDIKITIVGDASKAQKAFADAGTSAGTFEGKIDGLGSKFGTFAGTLGGVVTGGALASLPGILMDGAKGATEDAAAMDKLKQAVTNTGSSYDDYGGSIDEAIKRGQDLAFTDGETADALSTLIGLTGDTDEGMRRLSLAQDLARGTGMDLQTAAKLLGKTSEENTSALSRYGIQLDKNATSQDVLNAVDQKFGGQAGTFAESDAGKLLKAEQASGELAETFGSFLIPAMLLAAQTANQIGNVLETYVAPAFQAVIDAVGPVVSTFASFVADNAGPLIAALVGIGTAILVTVIPSLVAWVAGMVPVIAAHVTMAVAVLAAYAPIILIIAAVGVAAAALYLAWESNLFGIQEITATVWGFIGPLISTAISGIVTAIETGLSVIQSVWNVVFPAIQAVVETVFPIIATVAATYIGILKTEIELGVAAARWAFDNVFVPIQGIVSDVFTTIAGLVTTLWGPAVEAIKTGVQAAKTAYDEIFVPIQGVVSDVFTTIVGLVDSLWNGAEGAVAKIGQGLEAAKAFFVGVYDTFKGFGSAITDGLMDGIGDIVGKVKGIINEAIGWANTGISRINSAMEFTIPGFDPPGPGPKIPDLTVNPADIPTIPLLAQGGIVPATRGGRLVNVSEGGYAEAIIPLNSPQGRGMLGGGDDAFLTRLETLLAQHADRVERAVERGSNRALRGAI